MSDFIWIITSCNIYLNNWVVILKQLDIGLKWIVFMLITQLQLAADNFKRIIAEDFVYF